MCNKIAMHASNENDKKIIHEDGIRIYCYGKNGTHTPFIRHFNDKDKDISNSIEKLKIKSLLDIMM